MTSFFHKEEAERERKRKSYGDKEECKVVITLTIVYIETEKNKKIKNIPRAIKKIKNSTHERCTTTRSFNER
jgi:hypothetical protein